MDFSLTLPKKHLSDLIDFLKSRHQQSLDPFGLDLEFTKKVLASFYPFYRHYFKVRLKGKQHLKDKPYIIVSNHSGQIAFDGALISMAFALELNPPRLVRPMVERFVPSIPFIGQWFAACGAVLGDRENCLRLLKRGESVLVFPEGLEGVAKDTKDFYRLQKFTKGFLRMAIETGTEILPLAVIGAEECYPFVYHFRKLGKILKLPTLPITPTFPLLGPLGILPLPSPIDIHIGKPISFPKTSEEITEEMIDQHLHYVEKEINSMIKWGLSDKRSFYSAHIKRHKKKSKPSELE